MRDVSVVVCTHRPERWPWLLECLGSLERQTLQPLEVIVVVDGSPEIQSYLEERNGPEITLSTPGPSGLSSARNLGLAHATGGFVAFLDDDAMAAETWLEALRDVLKDETVAGVSGISLPRWEGQCPRWMPEELLWTLGCTYRGTPTTRSDVRNVFGGDACFRRDIFTKFGGFNSSLGRMAAGLGGCEDTELCLRVRRKSRELRFIHEPAAVIHHRVPQSRRKAAYVLSRCRGEGCSKATLRMVAGKGKYPLSAEANYLIRTIPAGMMSHIGKFFRGDGWGLARATLLASAVASTIIAYGVMRIRGLWRRNYLRPPPQIDIPGSSSHTILSRHEG